MRAVNLRLAIGLIIGLCFASCTQSPTPAAQTLPTLAVLPSSTPLPTNTFTSQPTDTDEPTATPLPPTATPTDGAPTSRQWAFSKTFSAFDDTEQLFIERAANAPIDGDITQVTPILALRCNAGTFEMLVNLGTQVNVDMGLVDQANARIRLDRDPAQDIVMNKSQTGDALFFENAEQTLQSFNGHSTLLFGFTAFGGSFTSTTFSLDGLDTAIAPLLSPCRISTLPPTPEPTPQACGLLETTQAEAWVQQIKPVILDLQTIIIPSDVLTAENNIEAFTYPPCLSGARQYLLNVLNETYFSLTTSGVDAQTHMNNATTQLNLFENEMVRVTGQRTS